MVLALGHMHASTADTFTNNNEFIQVDIATVHKKAICVCPLGHYRAISEAITQLGLAPIRCL